MATSAAWTFSNNFPVSGSFTAACTSDCQAGNLISEGTVASLFMSRCSGGRTVRNTRFRVSLAASPCICRYLDQQTHVVDISGGLIRTSKGAQGYTNPPSACWHQICG